MRQRPVDRRLLLSSLGSGLVAALAGCSGSGDDTDTTTTASGEATTDTPGEATTTETRTPTTTLTTTATTTTTTHSGDGGGGDIESSGEYDGYLDGAQNYDGTTADRRGQTDVTVLVGEADGGNLGFSPPAVRIDPGMTVTFEWTGDGGAHNVRHVEDVFYSGSLVSREGATYAVRFEQPGVYKYRCQPHHALGMKGVVAVGDSDTPVTDPASVTEVASGDTQESATLAAGDGDEGDKLGYSVDVSADGEYVLAGAFRDDDPHGTEAGAAYVFQRTSDGWQQDAKLVAPDGSAEDWFGWDVALNGDGSVALVGAFRAAGSGSGSGVVHAFTRSSAGWDHQSKFTGDDTTADDRFGSAVDLTAAGDRALVGAWRASGGSRSGAAYVFERENGTWTQTARITPDTGVADAAFGRAAALTADGTRALVGADGESAAYLFERTGGAWQQQRRFADPGATSDSGSAENGFAGGVALADDGETAFVGTDQSATADNAGYTAAYRRTESGWTRETVLRPDNGFPGDKFGAALATTAAGETVLVGASNSNRYGENSGAATVFQRGTDGWTAAKSLSAFQTDEYDDFGIAVALTDDGSTGLIGARDAETKGSGETGAVYLFSDLAE